MTMYSFFYWINSSVLALPTTVFFLGTAVYLTLKFQFKQFTAFGRFLGLICGNLLGKKRLDKEGESATITGFQALFTAMATAIGTGSIVAPSMAIIIGGPGALFWLVLYIFCGAAIKFAEILLALKTRVTTQDGKIIGGPMQYLSLTSPFLASWYGIMMMCVLLSWQNAQSNTLATIFAQEGIPQWVIGAALAGLVFVVLRGGAQRVSFLATKLVPIMFVMYVGFSCYILFNNIHAVYQAIALVLGDVFSPIAFSAATLLRAANAGTFKGIFITEAGLGTAAIPHALADTKNYEDQAILGMYSSAADIVLSIISGLLVLVTGVWQMGEFRSTMIYESFKLHVPGFGQYILLISITLFVLTTVIGNGFNGLQIFSGFTQYRWRNIFIGIVSAIVFFGSLMPAPLVWEMVNTILALAAFPHLIGLLMLVKRMDIK